MSKNYYETLGVDKNATADEIKKSYRKLSLKYHPDRQAGKSEKEVKEAEEKFKDIAEAYSILSDENKRKQYDMFGTVDGNMYGNGGFGFNPFDLFRKMYADDEDFEFFNRGRNTQQVRKGSTIQFTTKITLEDLYNNSEHSIKYQRNKPCKTCGGKGSKTGTVETCPVCGGSGVVTHTQRNGYSVMMQTVPCNHCHGTGKIVKDPCPDCHGSGLERGEETISFEIPIGCTDGVYVIINGAGNYPERNDGIVGDLKIIFRIEPHERYTIDANNQFNLLTTVEIPILDCITGCDSEIIGLNGEKLPFTIQPNTYHGSKVVVRNRGLMMTNGRRGDIIVYIKQKMPKTLSDKEKKLIKELKSQKNFN